MGVDGDEDALVDRHVLGERRQRSGEDGGVGDKCYSEDLRNVPDRPSPRTPQEDGGRREHYRS